MRYYPGFFFFFFFDIVINNSVFWAFLNTIKTPLTRNRTFTVSGIEFVYIRKCKTGTL
mgnify:CR=1 FL=1